jgi:hypothetical protein
MSPGFVYGYPEKTLVQSASAMVVRIWTGGRMLLVALKTAEFYRCTVHFSAFCRVV